MIIHPLLNILLFGKKSSFFLASLALSFADSMSMEENMKIADAGEQEIEAEFDEAAKEGYELILLSNNQGVKRGFGDCTYSKCAYIMIIYDSILLVAIDYAYRNYSNKRPLVFIVPQNGAIIRRWRLFSKKRNKIILNSIIHIVNEPVQNQKKPFTVTLNCNTM